MELNTTTSVSETPASTMAMESTTTESVSETPALTTSMELNTTTIVSKTPALTMAMELNTTESVSETPVLTTTMELNTTTSVSETPESRTTMELNTTTSVSETPALTMTMELNTTTSVSETPASTMTMESTTTESVSETPALTSVSGIPESTTTVELNTTTSVSETTESRTTMELNTTTSVSETPASTMTMESTTRSVSETPVLTPIITTSVSETPESTTTMESTTSESGTQAEKLCNATKKAMNPTARPCEDFYEYACGGFEASNETTEKDPAGEAIKRIFDQANKENTTYLNFLNYFKSCMSYEENTTREQRMNLTVKHIREVGNFSTEKPPDNFDVISMLSKLLLRDSLPLFDINLDFDIEKDLRKEHKFVLKMVPPVFKTTLCVDVSETCYAKQMEAMIYNAENEGNVENDDYDEDDYANDAENQNRGRNEDRLNSEDHSKPVIDAIKQFPEFSWYDIGAIKDGVQYILDKILELRREKQGKVTALSEKMRDDLDFEKLVESSMNSSEFKNLEIYSNLNFASAIRRILQNRDIALLNNGLLGLYVYKTYNEMVLPGRTETYCRRAATSLMQQDAVNLYLSSFSTEERERRNNLAKTMFQKLINTFKSDVQDAAWLNVTRAAVENKIDKMSIELPYLPDNGKNVPEKVPVTLTGNFLHDTLMLQGQKRRAMYQMLGESANEHNIWTYFAPPYQTSASVIYGLNKVVMPYEAVDWSGVLGTSATSLDYLRVATLGTVIAHGIARHFDKTGITYYDHKITRPSSNIFHCKSPCNAYDVYGSYIQDNKNRGEEKKRIKLPSTGMDRMYPLDDLSLNDRIAEDIGVQLAYRTMQRSWRPSDLLPCLGSDNELKEKQFFLAYAQMHCTKEPITSSSVLLKEGHSLSGRIRIAQLAANDYQFMIRTWNCSNTSDENAGAYGQEGESIVKIFPSVVKEHSHTVQNSK